MGALTSPSDPNRRAALQADRQFGSACGETQRRPQSLQAGASPCTLVGVGLSNKGSMQVSSMGTVRSGAVCGAAPQMRRAAPASSRVGADGVQRSIVRVQAGRWGWMPEGGQGRI